MMDFYEVLDQVIDLLRSRGRVIYRALKAQFQLDDDLLETLKDELLFTHPVVDADGRGLVWTGEAGAQGIDREDIEQQRALAVRYGVSPTVVCLGFATRTLWALGYPDQALQRGHEAFALAWELAHPFSIALTLYLGADLHMHVRQEDRVREQAQALITLATEQGFAHWKGVGMFRQGWGLVAQEQREEGLVQMRQGMTDVLAAGAEVYRLVFLLPLAEAYGTRGQVAEGLQTLAEARTVSEATGQRLYEAGLYRLMGALRLQQAGPDAPQAEACFQQALDVARNQHAKSWELRAAMSLARLWQSQGKRQDAYALLAPVYGWFTEGFDTADLQEAKALLSELAP